VGIDLLKGAPLFGVGLGQFGEHHYLTVHNSYVLAAAELGFVGMLLWTSIVYVAVKVPVQALRTRAAPVCRSWAIALLASMGGLLTGILFLSFVYKNVLWLYVGLTGALYHAIRRHDPGFSVRFGIRDVGVLMLVDVAFLGAVWTYSGLKVGW
jgi:O-antigen ligase